MNLNEHFNIEIGTKGKGFVKLHYEKLNKKGKGLFELLNDKLQTLDKKKEIKEHLSRKRKVFIRAVSNIHSISYHICRKKWRFCDLHADLVPELNDRKVFHENYITLHPQTFGRRLKGKKGLILGYAPKKLELRSYGIVPISSQKDVGKVMKIVEQSFIRRLKRSKLWKPKKAHKRAQKKGLKRK
jgi:hypothetical protein